MQRLNCCLSFAQVNLAVQFHYLAVLIDLKIKFQHSVEGSEQCNNGYSKIEGDTEEEYNLGYQYGI